MNKKLVVRQNSYKDCAVACLLSIMRYYGIDPPYEELSYYLRVSKDGVNAYNLINGSKNYGFDGYGVHYSFEDIINSKVMFPIICHTISNNMYHFIVIYKVNRNSILIMDPSSNKNKISFDEFKKIYLGTSIVIYPIKKIDSISNHKTLTNFILEYLITIKKEVLLVFLLSLIVVILNLIINYFLTILIDNNYEINIIISLSLVFAIITIFKNIFTFIREKFLLRIENNIMSYINININRKLFNLPYLFFKNKSTGEIESRINDLSTFRDIISNVIVGISIDIIFIICSFIILFFINYKLLFISIIELVLYILITYIFKSRVRDNIENISIYESDYKKCLNESISGYETNKNIGAINMILKKLEIKYISFIDKINKYKSTKNIDSFIKNIISDLLYIVLIFYEVIYLYKGLITIGNIILFNTVIYYLKEPSKSIIDFNYNIIYLKNIYKRINDLFVVKTTNEKEEVCDINGDIIINNLSYSIDGLHNIFESVNLKIEYKSKYLIYGNSGIGKSTLVKILLKYLKEYSGDIYIDNINLLDISSKAIEYNFTYVSQNSFINNDTFKNNIIYERDVDNKDYEEVIKICNLNKLRDSKILRNNFVIEEDGFNISGGERQKIILARSLLNHFNYLILDEALSEVGLYEEIDIINKIFKKYEDKTIIYISHKKEIINLFKKKYKLERSKR